MIIIFNYALVCFSLLTIVISLLTLVLSLLCPPPSYFLMPYKQNPQHNIYGIGDWLLTCVQIIQTVMLYFTSALPQLSGHITY